jgi:choline-sulfatase
MLFDLVADPTESVNLVAELPVPSRTRAIAAGKAAPQAVQFGYPTPEPTPGSTPFLSTEKSFFPRINIAPTPPRTPSPARSISLPASDDPATLLAHFVEEVNTKWDLEALHQDVLVSQRRRRLCSDQGRADHLGL